MMKKRHIILSSILAVALGIGVATFALKQDISAAHAALEDEELVETFGFQDYQTIEVNTLDEFKAAVHSGNAYINVRSNLYTDVSGNHTAIGIAGRKYINLNGFALLGSQPGVLNIGTGTNVTIVHGRIAPNMAFDLNNDNLPYDNTINVFNGTLTLRDVTVIGTRSAISMYNSTVNIMDGCDIDSGINRYNIQTHPYAALMTASFAIGGNCKLNISGGTFYGKMEQHAWVAERMGVGYQGDQIDPQSEINLSGGKFKLGGLFRMGGSSEDLSELVHLYGGKLDISGFAFSDSDYDNAGHDSSIDKYNIVSKMRDKIQASYDAAVCDDDSHALAFIGKNATYNNYVDAIISQSEVNYWCQPSQISEDVINTNNPDDLPSSFYRIGYTCEVLGVQTYITAYLNQKMPLSDRLSFDTYGAIQTTQTVLEKELAVVYTDYFMSSLNNNKFYAYRGAQRQTYEWTLKNVATGYTKTEKGYSAFKIPSGTVGLYEVTCKISSTNKYGLEQSVTTNKATCTINSYISGNLKISFNNTSNDAVDAVFDEIVTLGQDSATSLSYSSNAKLDYQWYASYYQNMADAYAIPGATKSVYNYKVDYVGLRYFRLGVTARKTSGSYDFISDEVLSNVLCVNGKNFDSFIVRKDSSDKDVALGTEVLFQVSVIGASQATDLRYSWFIENDNDTYSQISDTNSTRIRYEGTKTPNLTVCRNDANGTYRYYCYVTDMRSGVSLTCKSEAFTLTYRDAGLPIIVRQPNSTANLGEAITQFSIVGLAAQSPDLASGGTIEYLWYKSTTCYPEGDSQFAPASLSYASTGKTVAEPMFNNQGVGIWFYYCKITNKVNGRTASINTQCIQVSVTSHTHPMTTKVTSAMPDEINCEVGDTINVSYEFEVTMNGGANPNTVTVFGEIYNSQLAPGYSVTSAATLISTSGNTRTYKVEFNKSIGAAGTYVFDGCIMVSANNDPYYDQDYLRGENGISGLTTVIHVAPKDNIPNIVNVSRNSTSEIVGNYDVGSFDYYRSGEIDILGSNVYDKQLHNLGTLTGYDNFEKYELYVENASGTMVKVGESSDRNALPSFNFSSFNNSLENEDKYEEGFDGTLKAFVRVFFDMPVDVLDMAYSGGGIDWPKGLYVEQGHSYDSSIFAINIVGECAHQDTRYERCNHDRNVVEVICYACGEIVEELPLHLTDVAEVPATCCDDGMQAHKVCDHCGKVFNANGQEVTQDALVINAKGHNYVKHNAKDPTCTDKGNVEYYECSDCHEVFLLVDGNYVEVHLEDVLIDVAHEASNKWSHNSQGHYHVCEKCGQIVGEVEPHVDEDVDGICDICGRDLNAAVETVHVTVVNGKFADGTTEGDFEVGAVVTVIADVYDDGRTFEGWYINGRKVSSEEEATLVINEACTIEARYSNIPEPVPPVDPDKGKNKGGLPAGAIVGIVIGSVLILGLGGFAIFWFVIKKKSFKDLFPKKK